MDLDYDSLTDDEMEIVSLDDLHTDLIDYMIDLGMDEEGVNMALNALDSGDFDRLIGIVPTGTAPEEMDDIVSLYIDFITAQNDEETESDTMSESVLNIAQRRQRAMTMRRFKGKLKNARARMANRVAGVDAIQRRARRAAVKAVRVMVAGDRGKSYATLTPGEKSVIDKRVEARKLVIGRLSKRLIPKVRQADRARLQAKSQDKQTNESLVSGYSTPIRKEVDVDVPDSEDAPPLGWYDNIAKGRWHKHYTVAGDFDRRFSVFRGMGSQAMQTLAISESSLFNLISRAELNGIDVDRVVSASSKSLSESATADVSLQSVITALAKAYNMTEKLSAIVESRDPEMVSEATGDNCMFITDKQVKEFEGLCDKLFAKFGIDFSFTKHFAERMSDSRNTPCLTLKELGGFIKKMYDDSGKKIKDNKDAEAVLKDLQSSINIPVVVNYNRTDDQFEVVLKTIMRKKDFKSPDKIVTYK